MTNTKFCFKCGTEIDSKAVICPKCGVPQEKVSFKGKTGTILMYMLGGFLILGGIGDIMFGHMIEGFFTLVVGLILIPSMRDYIAETTGKGRIKPIYTLVMVFILFMGVGMMIPDVSDVNIPVETSISTPTSVPTPEDMRVYKDARVLLPTQTEIGNGDGWSYTKKIYTHSNASASYVKDNRVVRIHIEILDNKDEAKEVFNNEFIRRRCDGYPSMEAGDMSLYEKLTSSLNPDIQRGMFIKDNVVVIISVNDYWLKPRDIRRYANDVERKM